MQTSRRHLLGMGAAGLFGATLLHPDAVARVTAAARRTLTRDPQEVAGDEDFWFQVQQAFTIDRSMLNFNNGGVSPTVRIAQEAMRRHYEHANNAPAHTMWRHQDPQVETVRAGLGRAFGVDMAEIAITRNASESLETLIYGIDLQAGDEVVGCTLDYPRMIQTYKQRERREGIKLNLVDVRCPIDDPAEVVAAYEQAITPKTKVLLCSHVVYVSGQIMPVRELCALGRRHGLPVIVDGAHAFAHLAFKQSDLDCDYYGTSLHKWLTAPHGTGMLYVRKSRIAETWPLMAAPEPMTDNIRKFEEIGTHPAANRLGIAEALAFYHALGAERKLARLRYLRDRWAGPLGADKRVRFATRLDPQHCGGFTTVAFEGIDSEALKSHLWMRHRILVVPIDYAGVQGIRVTPNVYTTVGEVDRFVAAVQDVLANGLPG